MSVSLRPSLLPQCTSCARRLANAGRRASSPFQQQLRGAKKASKLPQTLPVRLLKDVKAYGRKGSVVPVMAGLMRNEWFPSNTAAYVTPAQLRELKAKDVTIERDHMFATQAIGAEEQQETGPEVLEIAKPKPIEIEGISPQRSMELIENLVPSRIDFWRTPVEEKPKEQPKEQPRAQPRSRGMSAADVLAAASAPAASTADAEPRIPIYGSVSTMEVAAYIREQLAVNEEGSRVVVSDRDVSFLGGTEANDETRVKNLGDYEVEIKMKDSEAAVRRNVRIHKT